MAGECNSNIFSEKGLYVSQFEHDACGMGFVANISGEKTNDIVKDALEILVHMTHRGAVGADPLTGDGAGITTQIPHDFFVRELKKQKINLPEPNNYGVGMIFLPKIKEKNQKDLLNIFEKQCEKSNVQILGYRNVPVNNKCLGKGSLQSEPIIKQVFLKIDVEDPQKLSQKLYLTRRRTEIEISNSSLEGKNEFYFASFSRRTIVYKGMLLPEQVEVYYPDLSDPEYKSAIATMHSRFSTNTLPSWKLAQPFRYLCHNGEINTIIGNRKWMRARESAFEHKLFKEELHDLYPITSSDLSDTASLDNATEFFAYMGRDIPHVLMMLIPEVWDGNKFISKEKYDFYKFHAAMMEPWDGPAAVVATDGRYVCAVLDRNGLRPSRYIITKSGKLIVSSEVGTLNINPEDINKSDKLKPGMMLLLDTQESRIIEDTEIKSKYANEKPYGEWLDKNLKTLSCFPKAENESGLPSGSDLLNLQNSFGYTEEDKTIILKEMIETGKEPIGSMGTDTPLSVLSNRAKSLFTYFKQLFAQVTNPPIDSIRERCVMSLANFLGKERNILDPDENNAKRLLIERPVLTKEEFHKIENLKGEFKTKKISTLFKAKEGELEKAVHNLCENAINAINEGCDILILSDFGVNEEFTAIPALLVVSAVHIYTVRAGIRKRASIVLKTAEAREVNHFALLSSFGVDAVYPYLAYATVIDMVNEGEIDIQLETDKAIKNYIYAIDDGLLKIFSKMGISTFQSYQGAQIFEALGLKSDFINEYFEGTVSRIEGIGINEIEKETLLIHEKAYKKISPLTKILDIAGEYQWRRHGELHLWNPETIFHMHQAIRTNSLEHWKIFSELINNQKGKNVTLRSVFKIKRGKSIPIEKVESASEIIKRFCVSAMSFGSISKEAHETLAIAMNRLNAMSNSGEGGEDPIRFKPYPNGDLARSSVKQIASGRFGVSTHYMVNADELQIKMAQGAKPGEGGHLPGHKVNEIIASVRNSMPGVSLISPPPHHDIYSIEDLAQLIYDLKNVNPNARISVKLVSEIGVGTVASGVAKGHADMILISGFDGGTGASPYSSIKNAGLPWELGLSEAHQTLIMNGLRSRVRLQVDGQMRTGKDVIIGALLGAEEFGFGTASLIAVGCVMMRKCQKNLCPVGVATQDPELRKKFPGHVDHVINYFNFVANEVREYMAELGISKFDDLIGRTDLIELDDLSSHYKAKGIDFSRILFKPETKSQKDVLCTIKQNHNIDKVLDKKLIEYAKSAFEKNIKVEENLPIKNINRSVGAMLGGEISKRFGRDGLGNDLITFNFTGFAGQSFGAFLVKGITFNLTGQANDYVGKGMSGGRITIKFPDESTIESDKNIIAGNTILYGATGGEVYISGVVGERFGVRNSGAKAVVEGVGDHGLEYMTGGIVVILGQTGINFAAGMSGGVAYIYDCDNSFKSKVNMAMVNFDDISKSDEQELKTLIESHYKYTNSKKAKIVLEDWNKNINKFVKIMPVEYKRVLEERITLERAKGE